MTEEKEEDVMKSNLRIIWVVLLSVLLSVSLTACGGHGGGIPSAPTGVTASASDGQVSISWSAVSGATSYNIYWSTTSGVTKTSGTKITGATSPYSHTGLTNGMTYYYIVTAVNSSGESVDSNQVSAMPTAGVSWIISTIDSTGNVGEHTSIAVDANEKVYISYYDFTNGKLKYTTNVAGSWVTSIVDSASDYDTGIALDANGKVHIVYDGTGGDLKYATNAAGNWVTSTIESGAYSGVIGDDSIAIDSNGKIHISYFNAAGLDLKYATDASGTWQAFIVVNGGAATGTLPGYSASIDTDSNNKIHISYYDDASPDSIKYITNASGTWVVTTVDTIGLAAGWKTSLAVDYNNKVHITYYDWTTDALKCATNALGTWQTETVDNSSGSVWDASLAIDKVHNNQVHIAYDSYAGLKYATKSGGTWQISSVDASWTGSYNSIAIGSTSIHISYYDGYNFDLKYATKPLF
jgi:hypothetical protein